MKETRSRCGTTLAAATLALLTACGGDGPTSPTPRPTVTVTLSGSVREIYANLPPIADVAVEVVDGVNMGSRGITNAQGMYTLTGLTPGTLTIRFSREDYAEVRRTVTLSSDTTLDVTLERQNPARFTLSGVVNTPWNEVLDDVGVEATYEGRVVGGGTTNRSGTYSIPTLPPLDYLLRARKWGYDTPDVVVHLTGDMRHDIVMDRGLIVVQGSVEEAYPCLSPIDEARVEVVDGPDAGTAVFTGRAGDYRMTNIRWGVFRLRASKSGYGSSEVTVNVPPPGGPGVVINERFRLTRPGCPG